VETLTTSKGGRVPEGGYEEAVVAIIEGEDNDDIGVVAGDKTGEVENPGFNDIHNPFIANKQSVGDNALSFMAAGSVPAKAGFAVNSTTSDGFGPLRW
jgi:hypothetical protein